MAKVKPIGHIWGLELNRYVCFLFYGNRTTFGWDIANSIFDLENSRSRSWPKSNPMVPFEINRYVSFSFCGNCTYLKPNTHMSVKWKLSNSPWNPHLQYWIPIDQSCGLTESVKLCVLQGRTDDYSSWSFGQCWIQYHCREFSLRINVYYQSRENISPNGHHRFNVVTFFI